MQQIAEWLKKLGMSEYAARFTENGIDVSVLPHLTDQDLKDLGALLGHRRKILAATAELGSEPVAPPAPPPVPPAPVSAAAAPPPTAAATAAPDAAERRHLTVMFCDLVGSTTISAQLDCRGVARAGRRLS
jgi:hypothetical protein